MAYYRDEETRKVFQTTHPDHMKLKKGIIVEITEEEYDRAISAYSLGSGLKKVFATVKIEDYEAFRKRCRDERVTMDQAFALLVSQYAHGAVLTKVSKKALERFDYRKEHSVTIHGTLSGRIDEEAHKEKSHVSED